MGLWMHRYKVKLHGVAHTQDGICTPYMYGIDLYDRSFRKQTIE